MQRLKVSLASANSDTGRCASRFRYSGVSLFLQQGNVCGRRSLRVSAAGQKFVSPGSGSPGGAFS